VTLSVTSDALGRAYERLSPDQRLFLELVASGRAKSITEAVEQTGVSRSSYAAWKKNPDFAEVLTQVVGSDAPQSLVAYYGRLVSLASKAVDRLEGYLGQDCGEPDQQRDQARLALEYLRFLRSPRGMPKTGPVPKTQPPTLQGSAHTLTIGAMGGGVAHGG
jgi:hypothetical protein